MFMHDNSLMDGIHMYDLTHQEDFVKKFVYIKLNKLRSTCMCVFNPGKSRRNVLIKFKNKLCDTITRNFLKHVLESNPSKNYLPLNV